MTILSNGHQWKYSEFIDNKNYSFNKDQILKIEQNFSTLMKKFGYKTIYHNE